MAKFSSGGFARQALLDRAHAGGEPMGDPRAPSGIVESAVGCQILLDARCDQRMRVRSQHGRDGAHTGPAMSVAGQQRWRGLRFFQKFKNRDGLRDGRMPRFDQRWQTAQRIDRQVGGAALLPRIDVDVVLMRRHPFHVERDPHTKGG